MGNTLSPIIYYILFICLLILYFIFCLLTCQEDRLLKAGHPKIQNLIQETNAYDGMPLLGLWLFLIACIMMNLLISTNHLSWTLCLYIKAGMKGRSSILYRICFFCVTRNKKVSSICTIKQNNNCFTKSIFRRVLILYIRQKWI